LKNIGISSFLLKILHFYLILSILSSVWRTKFRDSRAPKGRIVPFGGFEQNNDIGEWGWGGGVEGKGDEGSRNHSVGYVKLIGMDIGKVFGVFEKKGNFKGFKIEKLINYSLFYFHFIFTDKIKRKSSAKICKI